MINKNKEEIFDKYVTPKNPFKPIIVKDNLELIKKERNIEINYIIKAISSIIYFSKEKEILLVYFTSNFWIKMLKNYNIPDDINIDNCYTLREIFVKYNNLVNQLYHGDRKSIIKKDINIYFDRDEFAFILDKNIRKYFANNKELSNCEILGFVEQFNPYYKKDKYIYKRDIHIFDNLNLDDNSSDFIETFNKIQIETMFKDNIIEFLNLMISKIKNISNFGTILELIDIKKILKVDKYFALLKAKYENVIKRQIESLTDRELDRAAMILAKFVDLIYIHEKNCSFIKNKIDRLDRKIKFLIYNELMRICKGDENKEMKEDDKYIEMKEFIYQKYLNESENINFSVFN